MVLAVDVGLSEDGARFAQERNDASRLERGASAIRHHCRSESHRRILSRPRKMSKPMSTQGACWSYWFYSAGARSLRGSK